MRIETRKDLGVGARAAEPDSPKTPLDHSDRLAVPPTVMSLRTTVKVDSGAA